MSEKHIIGPSRDEYDQELARAMTPTEAQRVEDEAWWSWWFQTAQWQLEEEQRRTEQ